MGNMGKAKVICAYQTKSNNNRVNKDREAELQPKRMQSCYDKLQKLGFEPKIVTETEINFQYERNTIQLFPYSGWFSGKWVGSGRGFAKLLRQLKK
jgi:hypothetical protein